MTMVNLKTFHILILVTVIDINHIEICASSPVSPGDSLLDPENDYPVSREFPNRLLGDERTNIRKLSEVFEESSKGEHGEQGLESKPKNNWAFDSDVNSNDNGYMPNVSILIGPKATFLPIQQIRNPPNLANYPMHVRFNADKTYQQGYLYPFIPGRMVVRTTGQKDWHGLSKKRMYLVKIRRYPKEDRLSIVRLK